MMRPAWRRLEDRCHVDLVRIAGLDEPALEKFVRLRRGQKEADREHARQQVLGHDGRGARRSTPCMELASDIGHADSAAEEAWRRTAYTVAQQERFRPVDPREEVIASQ